MEAHLALTRFHHRNLHYLSNSIMNSVISPGSVRAVTFFGGARDRYQLPLALAERDLLEAFVTEAYWPFEHPWIGKAARTAFPKSLRTLRHQDGLPSTRVTLDYASMLLPIANRFWPDHNLFRLADRSMGAKGRKIAARTGSPILSYSYYAHPAFAHGPDRPAHRLLFQMHPHPLTGRRILREELARHPWANGGLLQEEELRPNTQRFEELCEEPALATGWIAASTFTADTLIENGVPKGLVHVASYGVDPSEFPVRPKPKRHGGPLEVLFLGSMIQRKGLADLFEAMALIGSANVRLTLAGRGHIDEPLLAHYSHLRPTVIVSPPRNEVVHLMHRSDVLVLPSILEGFGHVIAEAMCAGLPVIATNHTCAPDLIRDGVEGWLIPIRAPAAIADRLTWCAEHPQELDAMSAAAAEQARRLTWKRFRESVANWYLSMLAS